METYQEMQPVKVDKPSHWEKFVDMKQPLIVFMDNVLGKYGVSETDLIKWEQLSELIYPNIDDNFIFIIVCLRDQIALKIKGNIRRNEALSWLFDSNVINISDENNCLTTNEKEDILMKYAKKHSRNPSRFEVESIVNVENQIGFPENCRIWSCQPHLILEDVFANNMFLVEEIRDISKKSHQDYLFLVLLMLSGGSLSLDKNTEELTSKIKKISKLCGVGEKLTIAQLKDMGDSLCSTFVEYNTETKKFSFQHDTIELAVFLCFGSDFPKITLEMCSLQALTKMCCVRNKDNSSNDCFLNFKILIEDDAYFTVIVERFNKPHEYRKRELFKCVAEALVWQSTRFSDYFLKTLSTSDQLVTFLSMQDLDEQSLMTYFIYADNATVVKGIVDKIAQYNIRNQDLVSRQILLATVNACLADKEHIDNHNNVDDFVLFAAASTGNVSIMDRLLRNGGNVNATISVKLRKELANTIKHCVSYPNEDSYHHGINLFHVACSNGRVDMVKYLMSSYPKMIHKISSRGFTSAHFIARSDNVEIMKLFSSEKLVTRKTMFGSTVLHVAAANGNLKMVKYLAETFPQMAYETSNKGCTVLYNAGYGGNIHVLNILLEKGLDIKARTDTGANILHISAANCQLPMVEYLIETYPFLITQTNNIGTTAVHYAATGGNLQILTALLEKGLDITAQNNDGKNVLHFSAETNHALMIKYLLESCTDLHKHTTKIGRTPLHYAASKGDVSMIEALLQAGSDIHARDNTGANILHLAALNKNISTVHYLLQAYPHLSQDITNDGHNVLHLCAKGGSISVMELFLQAGLDIKARATCGNNALHQAALSKKLEMVNYLIKKCPQLIHMTENEGFTALHGAAKAGDVEVIESLINAGSDILASNKDGTNVFHMAVSHDRLPAVQYLMDKFPKLVQLHNEKFGYTALHYACERSGVPMFKALIQAGVNVRARTRKEKDVLQLALKHNNISVVNFLLEF
ncbi:hypothetical protein ACJMK2_017246 [Sinanodonta woodiana]|uniref:Novel STAND NTPase 3 domain-containing protein n=1 Tax=Sinanodonta woodiana TaxID=1069815 RepID=A0ABD3UWA9_SINWO